MRLHFFSALVFFLLFTSLGSWGTEPTPDINNMDLDRIWRRLTPELTPLLKDRLQADLQRIPPGSGDTEVSIKKVNEIRIDLTQSPGFLNLNQSQITAALPLDPKGWNLYLDMIIHVVIKRKIITDVVTSVDLPVTLTLRGVRLLLNLELNSNDPTRPQIASYSPPAISYEMELTSNNDAVRFAIESSRNYFQQAMQHEVQQLIGSIQEQLRLLPGLPGPVLGEASMGTDQRFYHLPSRQLMENIEAKIFKYQVPYQTLLQVVTTQATPERESWSLAYERNSDLNSPIKAFSGEADSAIFTGHLLAAESFRYFSSQGADQSAEALNHIQILLAGVDHLLAAEGHTGLLVRETAPLNSQEGQRLLALGAASKQVSIEGQDWVAYSGEGGVSRDTYIGIIFGLGVAYDFVDDSEVRREASQKIQVLVDYLIQHNWFIASDRPILSSGQLAFFPTFWFGESIQKLAILKTAEHVNPMKYQAMMAAAAPLVQSSWFFSWLNTFDPGAYYKFNLNMLSFYQYLRLEQDPILRDNVLSAFHIMQRYLEPHRNPHFDLIAVALEPVQHLNLPPRIISELGELAERNHRAYSPLVLNSSGILFTDYRLPTMDTEVLTRPMGPGGVVSLPSNPLPLELRNVNDDFQWQTSPFRVAKPGAGDRRLEISGLDLLLPYWMGKAYRVF